NKWNGKVILIIHGYFEHTLINAWLINLLLSHGFMVYGFDLPGHGFSSGERFTIGEFSQYGDCLKSVIDFLPYQPHCIIGHSTGCAAIVDYLTRGNFFSGKVILASPLIKSFLYDYSRMGKKVIDKFTNSLPFFFHKHSNDPDFLLFKRFADIHAPNHLPLSWFDALERWNKLLPKRPVNKNSKIYIFQGTLDRTVEWKFNLQFIKHQFPNTTIKLLQGAEHNLFNDSDNFKNEILLKITQIISE
ncbi:MAG: alpha/beta hydrolase, partial [Lentisphaeria bacterium]